MKKVIFYTALALVTIGTFYSCKKEVAATTARTPNLPDEVYKYDEFSTGNFNPAGSIAVDNEMATLGRVLFYEAQLSQNNRVSCGSCHSQAKAFADHGALSVGFENKKTVRNTPAIVNPGTQSSYFWDMRETNLSAMVTQPIANHIEMGLDEPDYIVAKVKSLPYYAPLFEAAFGDANVSIDRVGQALSNFVGAMVSCNSKYDSGMQNNFANFTEQEARGKQLFTVSLPCGGCHGGENFSGWGSFTQNIGLEMDYADDGQPGVDWNTGGALDGWFKVPSLRNVEHTGPYMHDGRFNTLEEVVEFYNSGIQPHPQLAFMLRQGWDTGFGVFEDGPFIPGNSSTTIQPLRMNLSTDDKAALVAFLKTLSDDHFTSDIKFSDPFRAN